MRGRTPKPTGIKLLEGNPGKRPLNPNEPKPVRAAPTCPAHLNPTAKAEWKRLVRQLVLLGMLTELDRVPFAAYCQSYGRWVEAERRLAETPALIKLPTGYVQQNPWLAIANKQQDLMMKAAAELGLTPVSRTRVSAKPVSSYPKPWEPVVGPESKFYGLIGKRRDAPDEFFDD